MKKHSNNDNKKGQEQSREGADHWVELVARRFNQLFLFSPRRGTYTSLSTQSSYFVLVWHFWKKAKKRRSSKSVDRYKDWGEEGPRARDHTCLCVSSTLWKNLS